MHQAIGFHKYEMLLDGDPYPASTGPTPMKSTKITKNNGHLYSILFFVTKGTRRGSPLVRSDGDARNKMEYR